MTKKTRVRVARIAAGAVIAAGASLTAAGAAQAVGIGVDVAGVHVGVQTADEPGEGDETCSPLDPRCEEPTDPPTEPTDPPTEPTDPPTEPTDPPTEPTDPPTEPTDPPTEPTDPPTEPTDPPTKPTTDPTDPTTDPTTDPSEPGQTGAPDDDANTCTVDLDGAECADNNTDTDSVGNQPAEQGKGKDELAETGAAETTFLLIGAATMIAGGIGFRILPRLVNGRTAA
ncbi:LPXTG cell wall anchor domain-containing protein [Streptomyces sp. NBC_00876]|uniref:LPXTG cell wall anchor domain-containing protein n=1 Tax=Streptomyces sp. NBC_00876 TaxID=2975853 RepID=UPI00386610F7|nr:LPXTG cell wall anchor domain-containing protein [Streptomyces sp. NBC_00876]